MAADPYYRQCARNALFNDHVCKPNPVARRLIEWEHAFKYAGRQIIEPWATVPLCWYVHEGPGKNKRINEFLALRRATPEDLAKFPGVDWTQKLKYLSNKYDPLIFKKKI